MTVKRFLSGLDALPLAKLAVALAVFGLITGAWMLQARYRATNVTLPEHGSQDDDCSLWFVGSSSIHRWSSLDRDMAPWHAYNRGINGASFADILPRFANGDLSEGRPHAIILYAGENDIAAGTALRTIIRQLAAFVDLRNRKFADVPLILLSMKPSPGRRANLPDQRLFNAAVQHLIPNVRATYYADITTPLLTNGRLGDNYQLDGVHLNPHGYRILADVVRRRLIDILPPDTVRACTGQDQGVEPRNISRIRGASRSTAAA